MDSKYVTTRKDMDGVYTNEYLPTPLLHLLLTNSRTAIPTTIHFKVYLQDKKQINKPISENQ